MYHFDSIVVLITPSKLHILLPTSGLKLPETNTVEPFGQKIEFHHFSAFAGSLPLLLSQSHTRPLTFKIDKLMYVVLLFQRKRMYGTEISYT